MPEFTQTLTITWHSFETDMPESQKDLFIKDTDSIFPCKFFLAVNLDGVLHIWDSLGNNRACAPFEYKTRYLWTYADQIKSSRSTQDLL